MCFVFDSSCSFARDSLCRLFVVTALTSRLVGGWGSFLCRVVFCLFFVCFGMGEAWLFVSRGFVCGGRATLIPRLVFLAALK